MQVLFLQLQCCQCKILRFAWIGPWRVAPAGQWLPSQPDRAREARTPPNNIWQTQKGPIVALPGVAQAGGALPPPEGGLWSSGVGGGGVCLMVTDDGCSLKLDCPFPLCVCACAPAADDHTYHIDVPGRRPFLLLCVDSWAQWTGMLCDQINPSPSQTCGLLGRALCWLHVIMCKPYTPFGVLYSIRLCVRNESPIHNIGSCGRIRSKRMMFQLVMLFSGLPTCQSFRPPKIRWFKLRNLSRFSPASHFIWFTPWLCRELHDVWTELQDIHDAFGLRYQWGGSHSNKKLLCSLGIDTRNIVS